MFGISKGTQNADLFVLTVIPTHLKVFKKHQILDDVNIFVGLGIDQVHLILISSEPEACN